MARTPKGVRQINENLFQEGRAIIVTEENFNNLDWNNIPNGSLHVDNDGTISYKKEGQTTWLPAGIKDEATLVISRDSQFTDEFFKIITTDNGDGTFTYENERGERRTKPVIKDKGYVFELDKGTYLNGRNHLEVTIDGVLLRTVPNKGIEELSEVRFILCDTLEVGQEVSVRYIQWVRIGNPWPRIFMNQGINPETGVEIAPETAKEGDFWLKEAPDFEDDGLYEDFDDYRYPEVSWNDIIGKPTTVKGFGIKDPVSMEGHSHSLADIVDFNEEFVTNVGNAKRLNGYVLVDTIPETGDEIPEESKIIVRLDPITRKIDEKYIPNLDANKIKSDSIINPDNLPNISADKLIGTISLDNLPKIPANMIKENTTIALTNLPNIPTSKITGTVAVSSLPQIPVSKLSGIISESNLPERSEIYVQPNEPNNPKEGSVWFCTDITNGLQIKAYSSGEWIKFL